MNKGIDVMALAKLEGFAMILLGVIAGTLYSFGGLIHDLAFAGGLNSGTFLAFLSLLGMPLIFGIVGVVAGILHGLAGNLISSFFGIQFDI